MNNNMYLSKKTLTEILIKFVPLYIPSELVLLIWQFTAMGKIITRDELSLIDYKVCGFHTNTYNNINHGFIPSKIFFIFSANGTYMEKNINSPTPISIEWYITPQKFFNKYIASSEKFEILSDEAILEESRYASLIKEHAKIFESKV